LRVLLDENLPADLAVELPGVQASTVTDKGWSGVANGELLRRASGHIDALLTMDRNLQHQQNLAKLPFGVILIRAPSNRIVHLRPLIPALLEALQTLSPGELRVVGR
jgi:hypothetical protein